LNKVTTITENLVKDCSTDIEKMEKIYLFVRDEIVFDMMSGMLVSSDEVLTMGRGSCMNKAVLLKDMAKAAGIPSRLHFMEVRKEALEDLLHPGAYKLWPDSFLHTYPEVRLSDEWVSMEATFDAPLHEKLLEKRLNFGKHEERRNNSIEFSSKGVVGAQQGTAIEGAEPIFADDLLPLKRHLEEVPDWLAEMVPYLCDISSKWVREKVRS
jgi:transglutaminase-like putative cysteine protease